MSNLARYLPHNVQEFDDRMRAIIVKHMGTGQGNPTQWVVQACHECFQQGFGEGFAAGAKTPVTTVRATAKRIAPRDNDIIEG